MPGLSLVDTHAHLDMQEFDEDRHQVIGRAREAGVGKIVSVGIDLESSQSAIEMAETYPEVWAAVGFHPNEASRIKEQDIATLVQLTTHPRVVAIGEAGLDYHRDPSPREKQIQVFEGQLEIAFRLNLPIIIHCREAEQDMLRLLRDWNSQHSRIKEQPRGVIHCFNSGSRNSIEEAQEYLDMGFFLSLGAYIAYPASRHTHDVLRRLPLDRLVVETDCPFLPPQSHRGQRNEPAYLPLTIEVLAVIKGTTPETVAYQTTQNAHRLFRLG